MLPVRILTVIYKNYGTYLEFLGRIILFAFSLQKSIRIKKKQKKQNKKTKNKRITKMSVCLCWWKLFNHTWSHEKNIQCCEKHLTLLTTCRSPNRTQGRSAVSLVVANDHLDIPTGFVQAQMDNKLKHTYHYEKSKGPCVGYLFILISLCLPGYLLCIRTIACAKYLRGSLPEYRTLQCHGM